MGGVCRPSQRAGRGRDVLLQGQEGSRERGVSEYPQEAGMIGRLSWRAERYGKGRESLIGGPGEVVSASQRAGRGVEVLP